MSWNPHRLTKRLRTGLVLVAMTASGFVSVPRTLAQQPSWNCPPGCEPYMTQPYTPQPQMPAPYTPQPYMGQPSPGQTMLSPPAPGQAMPTQPAPSQFSGVDPGALALGPGAGTASGRASRALPNVISDSPLGTCATIRVDDVQLDFGHPNLQCSRLNLSENNSPIPADRFFVTYRHFENPTKIGIFDDIEPTDDLAGLRSNYSFDVEQIIFGLEQTVCDGLASIEVRLPLVVQLTSRVDLLGLSGVSSPEEANAVISDGLSERAEIGNLSFIFKSLLAETCTCAVSAGVGVLVPTAKDFKARGVIDGVDFGGNAGVVDLEFAFRGNNDTVDVLPFLAYSLMPSDVFFSQGFLQVAVPTNSSPARLVLADGFGTGGTINGSDVRGVYDTTIQGQTLLRLNTQFGLWLCECPNGNRAAALLEFHWTSTLNDVNQGNATILNSGALGEPIEFTTGNPANRVDVVNCTVGSSIETRSCNLIPAFTFPLSSGDNKPFDYEVSVLYNHFF